MTTKFTGGAYDGMELDHEQINAYCEFWSQPDDAGGRRKFVLLPPPESWDDLVVGRISKDDIAGAKWLYELKTTPSGVAWHAVTDSL